jgi:hypothetical protein
MDFDREWIVLLERDGARILVRHGGRPMVRYAAMLQIFREGRWQTIRLIDNAHNEHHHAPLCERHQARCRILRDW